MAALRLLTLEMVTILFIPGVGGAIKNVRADVGVKDCEEEEVQEREGRIGVSETKRVCGFEVKIV